MIPIILITCLVCAGAGVAYLIFKRRRRQASLVAAERAAARPLLEEGVMIYAAGNTDFSRLVPLARSYPDVAGEIIANCTASITGEARERLCELALTLALVHQWCEDTCAENLELRRKAYARLERVSFYEPVHRVAEGVLLRGIQDPDAEVRLLAARSLAHSENPHHATRVFEFALTESSEHRAVLARDIRQSSAYLCRTVVPNELAGSNPKRTLATLEILEAWECALKLDDLSPLMRSSSVDVRRKAMSLLPNTSLSWENRNALLAGLADDDPRVSAAAARSAGIMRATLAIGALELCQRKGDRELEQAAAAALELMRTAKENSLS